MKDEIMKEPIKMKIVDYMDIVHEVINPEFVYKPGGWGKDSPTSYMCEWWPEGNPDSIQIFMERDMWHITVNELNHYIDDYYKKEGIDEL